MKHSGNPLSKFPRHIQDQIGQALYPKTIATLIATVPSGGEVHEVGTMTPPPEATPLKRAVSTGDHFCTFVPIHIRSEANIREHWRVKSERVKSQRAAVTLYLGQWMRGYPKPSRIHLCRIAPRFLDSDNLSSGFKHVRDAIAALFGFDDRDPGVKWTYSEFKRGKEKPATGFDVTIEWGELPRCKCCGQILTRSGTT